MRRPSPLPPPPVKPTAPPRVPVDDAPASDFAATATAPVIPIDAPARPPGGEDAAGAGDVREDRPIGMLDVWRAAHARRRALRAEVRRFTGRQRRRRAMWAAALASVVVLVLVTLGAAYSPLLAVEEITVVGADQLDVEEVTAALAGQLDTPLPLVDESAVKSALVEFPLIESYTLEARPPHELVVRLVERTPIGLIKSAAGYTLVDAAGVALSTTQKKVGDSPVLKVTGGTGSDAFESVGQVMRSLPESIRQQVTAVTATSANDVTLRLGDARADVVWGSADDSALKAVTLAKIMKERPAKSVSTYDVSSPAAIVVR